MSPELHGRDAVMEWLSEHRKQSPYPLRHHATNVHRTGTDGDVTRARFYILVNQIANFVPFAVSSGVVDVGVRRGANGLEFTEMDVVLDTPELGPAVRAAPPTAPLVRERTRNTSPAASPSSPGPAPASVPDWRGTPADWA